MLARILTRAIDAQERWAKPLGDRVHGLPPRSSGGSCRFQNLVLVRQGETIHALHDQCARAGGPLSGGTIVDGCLECL
jgi:nitrite reductase/ring-hydroxylating ferredoxin subunit